MATERLLTHYRYSKHIGKMRQILQRNIFSTVKVGRAYLKQDFIYAGCVNCRSDNFELISESDRYGLPISKQLCKACGLLQTYPLPNPNFLKDFYTYDYRKLYAGANSPKKFEKLYAEQISRGQKLIDFFSGTNLFSLRDLNIYEIGCSYGGLLQCFGENAKSVKGCDLDIAAIEFARSKNLDVEVAHLPVGPFEENTLVVLSHVLEHLPDPLMALGAIADMLNIGDYLYIEVPGLEMLESGSYGGDFLRYIHIGHITDFTSASLDSLLTGMPYELCYIDKHIRAILRKTDDRSEKVVSDQTYRMTRDLILRLEDFRMGAS